MTVLSIQQWSTSLEERKVGLNYDRAKLFLAKEEPDEGVVDVCQVPGCGEPLEYGQASLLTARCSQGHIWAELDGDWFTL